MTDTCNNNGDAASSSRRRSPSSRIGLMSPVTEALFLSGAKGFNYPTLIANNITHVINTTLEVPLVVLEGVECTRIPVNDVSGEDIYRYFDLVADKINKLVTNNVRVLVHCVAGVSRSASFVLAYLMKYHKMNLRDAYIFLNAKRPIVRPNSSFFRQLIQYETTLYPANGNSVVMTKIRSFDDQEIDLPDLYVNEFKRMALLEMVVRRRNKLVEARQAASQDGSLP